MFYIGRLDWFFYKLLKSIHMPYIYKLKANFCGHEKEGHFHYKNFLRALKWVPAWHTYTVGTKYFSLIGSQKIVANQRAGILCLPCRYIMWVLILKLSKSFYNESDLLFHAHKSWLLICRYSEWTLFTRVNWFFFLALDEGGCSSNIVFNQFTSRH